MCANNYVRTYEDFILSEHLWMCRNAVSLVSRKSGHHCCSFVTHRCANIHGSEEESFPRKEDAPTIIGK